MDERAGEADLLRHACGIVGDDLVGGLVEAERVEQLVAAAGDVDDVDAVQQAGVTQQFAAAEAVDGAQAVGQDTDERLRACRVAPYVVAEDLDAAPSGRRVAIDRVVVLPASFGPTTPNIEPRGTVSVRSSTARWLPKFFVSSLSCMAGALAGPDGGVGGCSNRGTGGC